jgi:serine/threonine protein kinase
VARRKGRDQPVNALLPGYTDLQEIGGGAFATVFRAVEIETGRAVALKILKVDTIHAHLIETFHKEIQALAAVSDHPNIVTLYRPTSTADGRPVLVLELCRESLSHQLRTTGPIDPVQVTSIGIKISGALETAHRNGFLHRDMKPQNILVTQFGEPALADFGVAALQASAQVTAGVFGFTTLHAAPEMLEGHHLSPATDIYGLASTMYQLLTGMAPFATFENEAPASVILRILRDPVRPLRAANIPFALADLLERALSKQPEGRPRTALDFAVALQAVEMAQGWPETTFVAWGSDGNPADAPPGLVERGPMGVITDAPPRRSYRQPPDMSTTGGSPLPVPEPARRSNLPPLLPPNAPGAPVRPSVVVPEAGARAVVDPVAESSAPQAQPVAPLPVSPDPREPPPRPGPGLPPLTVAQSQPREVSSQQESPRRRSTPRFADPDHVSFTETSNIYEQTLGAQHRFQPPVQGSHSPATAIRFPVWAISGVAVAGVVILLAILLIAGVI